MTATNATNAMNADPSARDLDLRFSRKPSTLAFMLRAFYPSPGLRRVRQFPALRAEWRGQRLARGPVTTFVELTGLDPAHPGFALLHPHVVGFPLQMVILTHPAFPVPIWNVLQIRNHLLVHRRPAADSELDWETRVAGQRLLEKGAEVDLHTSVRSHGELVWESVNTFYFRGRVGGEDAASPLTRPPEVGDSDVRSWRVAEGSGWRFAGLTGDYNGIHCWDWYARRFGFRRALLHPQRVLGQCLARLPAPEALPQRLDVWLRGPVYYGSEVRMRRSSADGDVELALHVHDDERPAIVARWTAGAGVRPLLEPRCGAPPEAAGADCAVER